MHATETIEAHGSGPSLRLGYLLSQYPAINHAFMLREVRQLRRLGMEVHVLSVSAPDRPTELLTTEEREEAATAFYVKSQSFSHVAGCHIRTFFRRPRGYLSGLSLAWRFGSGRPKSILSQVLYFAEAVVVGCRMKKLGIDHIHSHFSSNVAILAASVHKITFSLTLHGPAEFADRSSFHIGEKIAACRFACGISEFGRSQMMLLSNPVHWHKIHVTRLGVDTQTIQLKADRKQSTPFHLICVARLAPEKAQSVLLEALADVVKCGRGVCLHLCGDGPDRARLERHVEALQLQQHVTFEGFLSQDRLRSAYQKADAMVLPSFEEGLPVVLMEAMARGIPCISTWIAGVPELIRGGIDGLTVPPGDARALAEAIVELVDDPERCTMLAERGRARVVQLADLETNVQQMARLFYGYCAGRTSVPTEAGINRRVSTQPLPKGTVSI
ncbi:MAG TPA: glycosyltransferase family 4 protein [Terracidiphilus sp.]|jgi:glycosyltransferase involved in cell wall biosynthesis|nr:glycosyltransferase family 4 protein [Terracidiphilus sp.]